VSIIGLQNLYLLVGEFYNFVFFLMEECLEMEVIRKKGGILKKNKLD